MTSSLAYVRFSHHVIMTRSKFCRSFGASSIFHFTRFFHPDTPGMYRAIFHHSSLYMIKISQIRSFRESSPSNSIQTIDERAKMPFLGCMTFVERFICKKMFVKSSVNVHCSALGSSHNPAKLSTVSSDGIEVDDGGSGPTCFSISSGQAGDVPKVSTTVGYWQRASDGSTNSLGGCSNRRLS
jgi:hypothetical protein